MATNPISFLDSAATVSGIGSDFQAIACLSDEALLSAQDAITAHRQQLDGYAAWVAGEIARRSRYELGYSGLAQRSGFRTAEALIQSKSKGTRAEAVTLVRMGTVMAETGAAQTLQDDPRLAPAVEIPWQGCLADAVTEAVLSIAEADAIRAGLGDVTDSVPASVLAAAAQQLVLEGADPPLTVDQLRRRARQVRDQIDEEGVATRERAQQEAQYLKLWKRSDGMYTGSLLLDAENGAYLTSVVDEITNPRRGGPRFMSEADLARADRLTADPRSTERIALESLLELVRIGTEADPGTIFGSRRPAVRIVVTREVLDHRAGHGIIEAGGEPLSLTTIDRTRCDTGTIIVTHDQHGGSLDVGREQRLFTVRQRIALAVRDGGCMWNGCERPPSWCEAHHIDEWLRDDGKTNIADGILLCRHHHMLLHNNGWRIIRDGATYWLIPPPSEDPTQSRRALPSKSTLPRALTTGPRPLPRAQTLGGAH